MPNHVAKQRHGGVVNNGRWYNMTREQIMVSVATANTEQLAEVEKVFTGNGVQVILDRKTLNYREAAEALNLSLGTIARLVVDGRLKTVETRMGRKRILNSSVTEFVTVAKQ